MRDKTFEVSFEIKDVARISRLWSYDISKYN
jgi:hypothetical protein